MELEEKVYFTPGELVQIKHDLPNKPVMLVVDKVSMTFKDKSEKTLLGMKCRWFTKDGLLQEAVFNTKDLQKVK